jgi:hypothetical protein
MMIEKREASWTAPALWRFAGIRTIHRISDEPFCANVDYNCHTPRLRPAVQLDVECQLARQLS